MNERLDDETDALVGRFERCELAPSEFDHRAHLTVAAWYLTALEPDDARERMRAGLLKFLARHGLDGYNETITLFWLKYLARRLAESPGAKPAALADAIVAGGGGSKLLYAHYSRELVHGQSARANWVEPDLLPLEF